MPTTPDLLTGEAEFFAWVAALVAEAIPVGEVVEMVESFDAT